jgi:hypothetical protein
MSITSIVATLLEVGYKVNNYIEDATDNAATNAKWTSTTEQEYTVPTNRRWFLFGGQVTRDANETLDIYIKDSSDNIIAHICDQAAATGIFHYPEEAMTGNLIFPLILDEGEYVHIVCGGAQGAGATASCVVVEVMSG